MSDDDFNEDDLDLVTAAVKGSKLTVKNDLAERHSTTVSASNAHKIMTRPDLIGVLPDTGKRYIGSMVKARNAYFKSEGVCTPAMLNGIKNEPKAIKAIEKSLGIELLFTGNNQKPLFYGDFISALSDALDEDGFTHEVKCFDSNEKHLRYCAFTEQDFIANEPMYYCQVQTQILCSGKFFGYISFYRENCEPEIKTLMVFANYEWQKQFLIRVELAKAYYSEILNSEPSKELATTVIAPNSELVKECLFYKDSNGHYKTRSRQEAVKLTKEWLDRDLASQIDFNLVCDLSNPNDIKDFKKRAADIQKFKKPLIAASSALADDAKKVKDTDVGVRQTIESVIDSYAELIVKPIKEKEDNEKRIAKEKQDAIDAENARLAEIELAKKARDVDVANEINKLRELPAKCEKYASVALESEIKTIRLLSFKAGFFGERLAEANDAKDVVIMKLENMLKTAVSAENQRTAEQLESQRIEKVNNLFVRFNAVISEMKGKPASELQDKINQINTAVFDANTLGVRYSEAIAKKDDVLDQLKVMLKSELDKECGNDLPVIENDAVVALEVEPSAYQLALDAICEYCESEGYYSLLDAIAKGDIPHVSFNP